jgi:hypothetical protein
VVLIIVVYDFAFALNDDVESRLLGHFISEFQFFAEFDLLQFLNVQSLPPLSHFSLLLTVKTFFWGCTFMIWSNVTKVFALGAWGLAIMLLAHLPRRCIRLLPHRTQFTLSSSFQLLLFYLLAKLRLEEIKVHPLLLVCGGVDWLRYEVFALFEFHGLEILTNKGDNDQLGKVREDWIALS